MDDHFRNILDNSSNNKQNLVSNEIIRFIPSNNGFIGSKPGYYFTNGSKGLGYYYDPQQKDVLNHKIEVSTDNLKRKREDSESNDQLDEDIDDINATNIEKILENAEKSGIVPLDANSIKQLLINFDKKINKNQKIRMKYPNEPDKFMETEIELNEQIQELYSIAAYPDLYHIVVQFGTVSSILGIITHENTDISIAAIGLLNELLDPDNIAEDDGAMILVEEFINQQGVELIIQNLSRLDDTSEEDSQGIFQTLSIVENLIDINKEYSKKFTHSTDLLKYLLTYLIKNLKIYNDNKLYVSEILSILLQSYTMNQYYLNKLVISFNNKNVNCIDIILQNIAVYRKKDPNNLDEEEMINNLFLSLYSLLLLPDNQILFHEAEGYELMIRCIKERNFISNPAIKTISYSITKYLNGCRKLIEVNGLKYIFPMLLGKNLPNRVSKKKINHPDRLELESIVVNTISQLCVQYVIIPLDEFHDVNRIIYQRIVNKFIENEFEKIDCCCELFIKYYNKVNEITNDNDEDDVIDERVEAGLLVLHDLSIILVFISLFDIEVINKIEMQLDNDKLTLVTLLEVFDDNIILLSENNSELIKSVESVEDPTEKSLLNDKITNEDTYINILKQLKETLLVKLVENNKINVANDENDEDN